MSQKPEIANAAMNDLTLTLHRKFNYSLHVDRVLGSRSNVSNKQPKMFLNLPATKFYGIGPKKSLDQTIDFINENRTLANRINHVNNRLDEVRGGTLGMSAKRSFKMSGSLH